MAAKSAVPVAQLLHVYIGGETYVYANYYVNCPFGARKLYGPIHHVVRFQSHRGRASYS